MADDDERELRQDLSATIGARRDLGPAYEVELVESFLDRIDATVLRRVDAELARRMGDDDDGGGSSPFIVAIVSLGTGIPITAIAGGIADLPGIITAWVGIVGVNAALALGRRPSGR